MYYKITDKKSQAYKDLAALRARELNIMGDNLAKVKKITEGLDWDLALQSGGPGSFKRVPSYSGFVFLDPEKVDPKVWVFSKEHGCYTPNGRSAKGKEIRQQLGELESSYYSNVLDALDITDYAGRFTTPFMVVKNDIVLLRLDDNQEPQQKEVEEITSKEFNQLLELKS